MTLDVGTSIFLLMVVSCGLLTLGGIIALLSQIERKRGIAIATAIAAIPAAYWWIMSLLYAKYI